MTIEYLRKNKLIVYEYIRGSQLHGIATPTSDTDYGGVYIAPQSVMYGMESEYQPTISDAKGDTVFFELRTWLSLLAKSNPNALESLFVPDEFIVYKHPCIQPILDNADKFLTMLAFQPMLGYSYSQIMKARGLNKKIVNPLVYKDVMDFCYLSLKSVGQARGGSIPLKDWLSKTKRKQSHIGLAAIPNMRDMYNVYYGDDKDYKGVVSSGVNASNEVRLSSIPKGEVPVADMSFNKDGYTSYCKLYKEYKDWEKNRNPVRYESNLDKNYDAKNVAECIRLIHMGIELAKTGKYNIVRPAEDRKFLLDIKAHKYEYDDIIKYVEEKKSEMEEYINGDEVRKILPDKVDINFVKKLLVQTRRKFYRKQRFYFAVRKIVSIFAHQFKKQKQYENH